MSHPPSADAESVLVDFFYAQPVGHAVEALHHAYAVHAADRTREVSVLLNAATPTELGDCCPWLTAVHPVRAPFLAPAPQAAASLASVPRQWDWVLDDPRRHQPLQLDLFPGMRDHYSAADVAFTARRGRRPLGAVPPSRSRHQPFRLELPAPAVAAASDLARTLTRPGAPLLALMPAGSSPASHYPSAASWVTVLDGLARALPRARVLLVGRRTRDERTATSFAEADLRRLLAHPVVAGDVLDAPLLEQLAAVQRCALFLAPHTGFGMAALAVGTPWLALSGGRWFEWYFDHVPFRSVVPDTTRFPCYSQFDADTPLADDDGDGPRIPSMTRARVQEDLPRLVHAARELLAGAVSYEQCLDDYAADLLAAHGGDASGLWSFDDVLAEHLPPPRTS
ncbi:hypothetical protein GTR02_17550 [Kineococcus sp. R8]|uniref:glycosyltransferase family 9 protein n=1 Tax=Kineococcus siccus TaxID=2696567 RepID=UPI0014121A16|nr:glycosyltransferase family 9 protein [Kineococcus siccus]NAZ83620.1 hypothetical protein [Kineococcus siccus]